MKVAVFKLEDGTILEFSDILERAGIPPELAASAASYTGFKDINNKMIFDRSRLKSFKPSVPGILDTVPPDTECSVTWDGKRGCWSVQYMSQGKLVMVPVPGKMLGEDEDGIRLEVELI